MPPIEKMTDELSDIWNSKWLTNMGKKHKSFEESLRKELKVPYVSLFNNGTIALLTALKALDLPAGSEVITTPFTFAATPHVISWNNLKPVFCDIEPETMTIDANKIEAAVTSRTSAILAVHVYGFPCNIKKIQAIAKKHNLKVIYDGAHVFSTEIDGKGIGNFGDITMFSFHATKLFNTAEGGCLTYRDSKLVDKIYNLRNFGIHNEDEVVDVGINGKMSEILASMGMLNLKIYRKEMAKRKRIRLKYNNLLSKVNGIKIPALSGNTTDSCQYFPIVLGKGYFQSRDELYCVLRKNNVMARKYFYPICSDFEPYKRMKSSQKDNLPVANDLKNRVLCLPFYGSLTEAQVAGICEIIAGKI